MLGLRSACLWTEGLNPLITPDYLLKMGRLFPSRLVWKVGLAGCYPQGDKKDPCIALLSQDGGLASGYTNYNINICVQITL